MIDTHSGYFEDYANAYINHNKDVVRRYQELTIQAYLEERTPAVQKAKKSLEGEISADSDSLIIDGYEGTWYVVDTETVDGKVVDVEGKETHPVTIMGTVYNDRKEAGAKLKSLIAANAARIADGKDFEIGEYRGFKLSIFFDTLSKHVKACLDGEKHHYCDLNPETDTGNLIRLDNCINNIQKTVLFLLLSVQEQHISLSQQLSSYSCSDD